MENNQKPIAYVCAWCDTDKHETAKLESMGFCVSHGICPKHKQELVRELEEKHGTRYSHILRR